jgi:hypothetical protein
MLLNELRHICFTFSYYSFLTRWACLKLIVGLVPLTIKIVSSLANHYTNMINWSNKNKKYTFLSMGFMI